MKRNRKKFGIKEARRLAELLDGIRENLDPANRWHIEAEEINRKFISGLLASQSARLFALARLEYIMSEIQSANEFQLMMNLGDDPDSEEGPAGKTAEES